MMNSARYIDLNIEAKLNCVDIFVHKVCPYEDYDNNYTLEDVEYNIAEWLNNNNDYAIDIDGNWFEKVFRKI